MQNTKPKSRFEFKYIVPRGKLDSLRALLSPYVNADRYMEQAGPEGYLVRSIYFDTPQFSFYHEKKAGIKRRKKIRVRGYNTGSDDSTVFLEIKHKNGKKVWKNRAPVRYANLSEACATGSNPSDYIIRGIGFDDRAEDARRFMYHLHRYALKPTVLVIYRREAYFGKCDRSLRLTFDMGLRGTLFPELTELFYENNTQHSIPYHFIFEVKFFDNYPVWLRRIIALLNLQLGSFSKYTTCIEEQTDIDEIPSSMLRRYHQTIQL